MSVEEILRQLRLLYDYTKIELRRDFEARTWKTSQSFLDYHHDKVLKAHRVPVPEDEILDYIIVGISDRQLRNQARAQKFASIADLVESFKEVDIHPDAVVKHRTTSDISTRNETQTTKDIKGARTMM